MTSEKEVAQVVCRQILETMVPGLEKMGLSNRAGIAQGLEMAAAELRKNAPSNDLPR